MLIHVAFSYTLVQTLRVAKETLPFLALLPASELFENMQISNFELGCIVINKTENLELY